MNLVETVIEAYENGHRFRSPRHPWEFEVVTLSQGGVTIQSWHSFDIPVWGNCEFGAADLLAHDWELIKPTRASRTKKPQPQSASPANVGAECEHPSTITKFSGARVCESCDSVVGGR